MFFEKGRRPLNSNKEIDLLEGVYRPRKGYPTEKPREVLRTLMLNSSSPGDLVLDPFCGSGASGRCAEALGRTALMIDILPESQTGSSLIAEEN
jgi:site-specific DNA-methyltransferase (adenine-specific)